MMTDSARAYELPLSLLPLAPEILEYIDGLDGTEGGLHLTPAGSGTSPSSKIPTNSGPDSGILSATRWRPRQLCGRAKR